MKYQFNGFTKGANNALCFAIETAEEMGHTYVGSEHLLVGLLKEQEGAAASLLAARNVTAEQVAELLASTVGRGIPSSLTPDSFTPRAKQVIEIALSGARATGNTYAGTEHLLIALLEEGRSIADISERLSFSSQNYFTVVFKRETGVSPGVYRNRLKKRSAGLPPMG